MATAAPSDSGNPRTRVWRALGPPVEDATTTSRLATTRGPVLGCRCWGVMSGRDRSRPGAAGAFDAPGVDVPAAAAADLAAALLARVRVIAATWRWRRNEASGIAAAASILPIRSSPTRPMSMDSEPDGLGTKSIAPNSSESSVIWAFCVVRLESMTTRVGVSSMSRLSIPSPSRTGISTSRVMTSGRSSAASLSPSSPFAAAPTTSSWGASPIRRARAWRMKAESSMIRTRMVAILTLAFRLAGRRSRSGRLAGRDSCAPRTLRLPAAC